MVNISNMPMGVAEELVFTKEEIEELMVDREKSIVFDDECPETSPERAM